MGKFFKFPHDYSEFTYRFVRGLLYAFTFILCILALSLIIFSFWYIFEGENYHLDTKIKSIVFSVSFILGVILLILSVFGLCGVLRESLFLSKAFLFGMSGLVIVEFICIFLIYAYREKILEHASDLFQGFMTHYTQDDDIRGLVDKIQSDLKCCGISNSNDWDYNTYFNCSSSTALACSVPPSCCFNFKMNDPKADVLCGVGIRSEDNLNIMFKVIHTTGCKHAIHSFLEYKHHLTALFSVGFIIPQIIGIILIIAFISILHFLVLIEYDKNEILYGQFKQDYNDLTNTSRFIKFNLNTERTNFLKKLNLSSIKVPNKELSSHAVAAQKNKQRVNIYQIQST